MDELQKGFIPIMGGTHRIRQIPFEIGIYLALTGEKLAYHEMRKLKFLQAEVQKGITNKDLRESLSEANLKVDTPYSPNLFSDNNEDIFEYAQEKMEKINQKIDAANQFIINSSKNYLVQLATQKYNMSRVILENAKNPLSCFSQKQNKMEITNYFQLRKERTFNYLVKKGVVSTSTYSLENDVNIPISKIMRIFCKPTLSEIFNSLEQDGSEWAKRTAEKIRKNDPLATVLTFNLLNKAKGKSWVECLEMEFAVARRLLD